MITNPMLRYNYVIANTKKKMNLEDYFLLRISVYNTAQRAN
jgi:hypothetical protein